ncbi:hypothetical protein [Streptomyces sp. NPDC048172]|uniref:hypothetical protein n=1 Tax=Streptomyces sp. NPDC048172 TaxID=3365505 RepID=UPI00371218AF
MDQGVAAIAGAVVGALATGGTALVAARSSFRVQKSQARRAAYHELLLALRDLYGPARRCLLESLARTEGEYAALSDEALVALRDEVNGLILPVSRACVAIELEGPDALVEIAKEAADDAKYHAHAALSMAWSADAGREVTEAEKRNAQDAYGRTVTSTNRFSEHARRQL